MASHSCTPDSSRFEDPDNDHNVASWPVNGTAEALVGVIAYRGLSHELAQRTRNALLNDEAFKQIHKAIEVNSRDATHLREALDWLSGNTSRKVAPTFAVNSSIYGGIYPAHWGHWRQNPRSTGLTPAMIT